MTIRLLPAVAAWVAIVAVSACQSTLPYVPPAQNSMVAASEAASILVRAAQARGADAAELYLAAGLAFLTQGQPAAARDALSTVDLASLHTRNHASYWYASAQLALEAGAPARAKAMFQQALDAPSSSSAPAQPAMIEMGVRLCLLLEEFELDRYACAVHQLSDFVPQPAHVQYTHDQIWDLLGRSPAMLINTQVSESSGDAHAWWQLKAAMLASFSVADQRQRLRQWKQQWPLHPASQRPPTTLLALSKDSAGPRHVALLVPLSGPLARAGRAVRDGFISAHLHAVEQLRLLTGAVVTAPTTATLTISIFDSAANPIPLLLEQALLQGADIIVGPLDKNRVEKINSLNPSIPVLTLNYLNENIPLSRKVTQLGLAIEDEADSILNRLLEDNVQRVLIFHSHKDWSRRAAQRISDNWHLPITVQAFVDIRTVTESVSQAMGVQASQSRRDELARALGTDLQFLPRARQDIDAIVALVDTLEATALVPALRFNFAQAVPVYATSQTVRGARSGDLRDLEGFHISELPWFLYSDGFYESMDNTFGITGNPFSSLYALGADAFRMSDRLPLLTRRSVYQFVGSTGILLLEKNGRIRRQLVWGTISGAVLTPLPAKR